MEHDKVWLTMAPEGMRTLVTVYESGAIEIASAITVQEAPHVARILSMHARERLAEEQRLRARVKELGG